MSCETCWGYSSVAQPRAARERWRLLAAALGCQPNGAAVARAPKWYLKLVALNYTGSTDKEGSWYAATPRFFDLQATDPRIEVRFLSEDRCLTLGCLTGFNNTGNIGLWHSEELLVWEVLREGAKRFEGSTVIELGGGMTSLAGLMLAATGKPRQVWLTDGNVTSAANLQAIVHRNQELGLLQCCTKSGLLRWDQMEKWPMRVQNQMGSFDWVLGADVFFFTEYHQALLDSLLRLLKPPLGKALFFAPARGDSFDRFVETAKQSAKLRISVRGRSLWQEIANQSGADLENIQSDFSDVSKTLPLMLMLELV